MAAKAPGSFRKSSSALTSLSPSGRASLSESPSSSSAAFASSSSRFSSSPATFFANPHNRNNQQRSASPARVNVYGQAPSIRFSLGRPVSPNRSSSNVNQIVKKQNSQAKRTCMCSPTTHPGSFRCSLHKNLNNSRSSNYSQSNRLQARRSAMTNSLVRIGGVEGDLVKRALAALIRPSSHQQRRRAASELRPSRLSVMSTA